MFTTSFLTLQPHAWRAVFAECLLKLRLEQWEFRWQADGLENSRFRIRHSRRFRVFFTRVQRILGVAGYIGLRPK